MFTVKVIRIWTVLLAVAVANGAARVAILEPRLGERVAHQMSCATASLLILLAATDLIPALGRTSTASLLGIGALWLLLTVTFEFTFGRFVSGLSWERLIADYNLLEGRLWVLVLATVFVAPLVAVKLRAVAAHPALAARAGTRRK
jgi:hypothetical protein